MSPLEFVAVTFAVAFVSGLLGSLLGLGGGIILVPALTVLLGVDIRYAIGASLVGVIATSSGAALRYLREGLINLRLALFLETGTTAGAVLGAYLAGIVHARALYLIFAGLAMYVTVLMFRNKPASRTAAEAGDGVARRLGLGGAYYEHGSGEIDYEVVRTRAGLGLSALAGTASGLLGVGGGFMLVPTMRLGMGVPLKVSTATSTFMIGITATTGAVFYFHRGDVAACIAAPVAAGVLLGAMAGSRVLHRVPAKALRLVFVAVLAWIAVSMAAKGLGL